MSLREFYCPLTQYWYVVRPDFSVVIRLPAISAMKNKGGGWDVKIHEGHWETQVPERELPQ